MKNFHIGNHSPRPWRVDFCCEEDCDSPSIVDSNNDVICQMDGGNGIEETHVNAHLIATTLETLDERDRLKRENSELWEALLKVKTRLDHLIAISKDNSQSS